MEDFVFVSGVIPSEEDIRDYKYAICESESVVAPWKNLTEFSIDNMPPAKNQGGVGSCVAHSLSTIIEWYQQKDKNRYDKMSTMWIYGDRTNTTHKDPGMSIKGALDNLLNKGVIIEGALPGNTEVPKCMETFETYYDDFKHSAQINRIKGYFRLYSVDELKSALYNNGPVAVSITFYQNTKQKISLTHGKFITVDLANAGKVTGAHCMVIYGWTESGWLIQNSWGTSWGKDGRGVLDFNYRINELWGVEDDHTGVPLYEYNLQRQIIELTAERDGLREAVQAKTLSYNANVEQLTNQINKQATELVQKEQEKLASEQARIKAEESAEQAQKTMVELHARFTEIKNNIDAEANDATAAMNSLSTAFQKLLSMTSVDEFYAEQLNYNALVEDIKQTIADLNPTYSNYVLELLQSNEQTLDEINQSYILEEEVRNYEQQIKECPYTIIKTKLPKIGKWITRLCNWIINKYIK